MGTIRNDNNISMIQFNQNIQAFCPMGHDFYTNHITVSFCPGDLIPDYCDVEKFMRSLAGKELIIEDVVGIVFDYLKENYQPENLAVTSTVDDAVHFPVKVTKTM